MGVISGRCCGPQPEIDLHSHDPKPSTCASDKTRPAGKTLRVKPGANKRARVTEITRFDRRHRPHAPARAKPSSKPRILDNPIFATRPSRAATKVRSSAPSPAAVQNSRPARHESRRHPREIPQVL